MQNVLYTDVDHMGGSRLMSASLDLNYMLVCSAYLLYGGECTSLVATVRTSYYHVLQYT